VLLFNKVSSGVEYLAFVAKSTVGALNLQNLKMTDHEKQ